MSYIGILEEFLCTAIANWMPLSIGCGFQILSMLCDCCSDSIVNVLGVRACDLLVDGNHCFLND